MKEEAATRYLCQRLLEGVEEEGQKLFFATEVHCEGEGIVLQTAAAYLEAAGFYLKAREADFHPGFWPPSWKPPKKKRPPPHDAPPPPTELKQRGFLGCLPCMCPDGFDFWVVMGCFRGAPGFVFAKGQSKRPFLDAEMAAGMVLSAKSSPAHFSAAAWAALVFEKLALGQGAKAGGGHIDESGSATLFEEPS